MKGMNFRFSIHNHSFEKGTPWVKVDKVRQQCWLISIDIEDDGEVPCYDTEDERYSTGVDYRLDKDISFKSVKILTEKNQATHPYWEALLDMSYTNSAELRDAIVKSLPDEDGIYMSNLWLEDEGIKFGTFKKLGSESDKE